MQIRKAVIPAAGLGTRFLPVTMSVPKELLPIVDRPLLQYVIAEAAEALDIDLDHFCGGCCSCGTCRVEVLRGEQSLSRAQPDESLVLGPTALDAGDRLACQAHIHGQVRVRIPRFFGVRDEK